MSEAETLSLMALALVVVIGVAGLVVIRSHLDAVVILTFFIITLFGINARWVIPGAGAIGTPAMAVAALAAWAWWTAKFAPSLRLDRNPNPVRVALLAYLWFTALSWGLARLHPLSRLEVNASNRALIAAVGLTGIALLCADSVDSSQRLLALIRRIAMAGAFLSLVGIIQFVTRIDLVARVRFPGLVLNSEIQALATRWGFRRAEGTALHSIEFSVVLAMVLPLAIHLAMYGSNERERRRYAMASAVIAVGLPLSVSRSSILAVAVALLVMSVTWTWRQRVIGIFVTLGATMAMWVAVPGLVEAQRILVLGAGSDPSVTARIDRVPLALARFSDSYWFGSGIGTFSPVEDFLLDNQYLATLIQTGILGLGAVLGLLGTAAYACLRVRRQTSDAATRHLAQALLAGIAVVPAIMAVFDAFFYRILMGVVFLLIGISGHLWRLEVRDRHRPPVTVRHARVQ